MYASEVRLCLEVWVGLKSEVTLISLMTSTFPNFAEKKEKKKWVWKKIQLYSLDLFLILFWLLFTGLLSKYTVYFRADFSPSRLKFQWVSLIPLDCNPKWAMVFYSEYSSWIMMLSATRRNQAVCIWGARMHTEAHGSSCIRPCKLPHAHTHTQTNVLQEHAHGSFYAMHIWTKQLHSPMSLSQGNRNASCLWSFPKSRKTSQQCWPTSHH